MSPVLPSQYHRLTCSGNCHLSAAPQLRGKPGGLRLTFSSAVPQHGLIHIPRGLRVSSSCSETALLCGNWGHALAFVLCTDLASCCPVPPDQLSLPKPNALPRAARADLQAKLGSGKLVRFELNMHGTFPRASKDGSGGGNVRVHCLEAALSCFAQAFPKNASRG